MIRLHTPTYSTDVARSLAGGLLTFDAIATSPGYEGCFLPLRGHLMLPGHRRAYRVHVIVIAP